MIGRLKADSTFSVDAQLAWDSHDTDVSGRTARGLYVVGKDALMKGSEGRERPRCGSTSTRRGSPALRASRST